MTLRYTLSALAIVAAGPALADCETVVFSDVGWTDITATSAATTVVLEALGYDTDIKVLSVPVTYTSLAAGDVDVFLGNWMPTMEADIAPYREAGTVDTVRANLQGAKYTLAVNKVAADMGIADFADIAAHADALVALATRSPATADAPVDLEGEWGHGPEFRVQSDRPHTVFCAQVDDALAAFDRLAEVIVHASCHSCIHVGARVEH